MSSSSGIPTTPNSSHLLRSGLPTPSGSSRRTTIARSGVSPIDSPDTLFKKQSLAEAISRNDPAKYRLSSSSHPSPSPSSPNKDASDPDSNSPLLTAGRLPRSSLLARKSTTGLRSQTPTGRYTPASQLSPSGTDVTRTSSAASTSSPRQGTNYTSPSSQSRFETSPASNLGSTRSKSPLITSAITTTPAARNFATPRRYSNVHTSARVGATVNRTPSHTSSTVASRARESERRGRELEIGDLVRMEGSDLVGVLRHLGPVDFKPGFYAGLELTGDSVGKGKNDGSVQGTQYFACAPANGLFCPASKVVAINDEPPTDAVPRPASSLSNRPSSRASQVAADRQSSLTPARRRASMASRPPSSTPSRASSRASVRPPSVTPGSRPASALSTSRPGSRLAARKSLGASLVRADDDDDLLSQRSRNAAQRAAIAEQKITQGSRAHKLLGLSARDLEHRHQDPLQSRSPSSSRATEAASPLKSGLPTPSTLTASTPRSSMAVASTSSANAQATPVLAKKRQSLGGIPTPRPNKGRASMFARPSATIDSSMPPPPSPSKETRTERSVSSLSFRSNSRLGRDSLDLDSSPASNSKIQTDPGLERNRLLLEQMDLTPRRPSSRMVRPQSRADSRAASLASAAEDDMIQNSIAEAVVPLALYEEQVAEFERLRVQCEELDKQNHDLRRAQEARKGRDAEMRSNQALLDQERSKMRAEARDRQAEMEEERKLEREDEIRRRREIEDRERETKEKLQQAQSQLSKVADELEKLKSDFDSQKRGLQSKVEESENLIQELKNGIQQGSQETQQGETLEALETQVKLKDAEIGSLRASLARLEAETQQERDALTKQIDDLKDAGRETIGLYEQRIDEIDRERLEVLDNMLLLETKAQEAIRAAEAKFEELQASQTAVRGSGLTGLAGAAEIDNEALKEQVNHLQDRLGKYEDQIAEAALNLEKEKEFSQKRRDRSHEVEASLKNEIKRLKNELDRLTKEEKEHRQALQETQRALEESQMALERERAELEVLRADVQNIESLDGGAMRAASAAPHKQWLIERSKMESEIADLKAKLTSNISFTVEGTDRNMVELLEKQLEAKDDELRHVRGRLEQARQASRGSLVSQVHAELPSEVSADSNPNYHDVLSATKDDRRMSTASATSITSSTSTRKSSHRLSSNGATAPSDASTVSSANQVSGLSYLVRQLTEENNEVKSKYKLMESELKERLQDAQTKARTLELTVGSLRKQLEASSGNIQTSDQEDLAVRLADYEARFHRSEEDVNVLRSNLENAERDKRRVADSLQKEVSELETLVEARIFREDELVAEIDRLKRKLEKHSSVRVDGNASSVAIAATQPSLPATSQVGDHAAPVDPSKRQSQQASDHGGKMDASKDEDLDFCGLCSKRGHSLEDCDLARQPIRHATESGPTQGQSGDAGQEPCDDCGEVGHKFEDCPYAAEIF